MSSTSNTGERSTIYHALYWIRQRRKPVDPTVSSHYNLVLDGDYRVKLFATCSIRPPVANKTSVIAPPLGAGGSTHVPYYYLVGDVVAY